MAANRFNKNRALSEQQRYHTELDFTRISVLYANTNAGYFGIATGVFFFA